MNSGGVDLLHRPLVVASSSPPQIDITMRDDMAQISGAVSDIKANGDSLPRRRSIVPSQSPARVYCVPLPDSNGTFQEIAVMPDGNFASVPMAPGAYRVLAFAHPKPRLPYRDPVAMRVYETQGQVLNLVPGQSEHLQLQLIQGD
jgi:hypothetical protein